MYVYIIGYRVRLLTKTTSAALSEPESIIFLCILAKDSTPARTETSNRYSASPRRRGDEVALALPV